jgi:arginine decarboxylase
VHSDNESLIVCNGYKDDNFIRTALRRAQAGQAGDPHRGEARRGRGDHPHRQGDGRRADDRPARAPLAKGAGKWATSGGEHAKFGLATAEILVARGRSCATRG